MAVKLKQTLPRKLQECLDKLRVIKSSMLGNPFFAQRSAELAALLTRFSALIDQLVVAYDEARNHDSQKIAFRDQLFDQARSLVKKIAALVEVIADGDVSILRSSGFDFAQEKSSSKKHGLRAPTVTVEPDPTDGTVKVNVEFVEGTIVFQAFITVNDQAGPPNWREQGLYPPGNDIILSGLPKQPHALKMRCLGEDGAGEWSLPFPFVPS